MTHVDTGPDGNTKIIRSRAWCFTLNNYDVKDIDTLINSFDNSSKYIFQEEKGESGTPHLQGFIYYNNARTFESMKKIHDKVHWERCRNIEASEKYCQKSETNNGQKWVKGYPEPLEIDLGNGLKKWQLKIEEDLKKKPHNRTINWIVDKIGGQGKTTFCKYLCNKYKETCFYLSGKSGDMKHVIATAKTKPKIILIDYTRSQETYVSYEGMESIKNGIFMSGKYESTQVIYNTPHMYVFSNFDPDETQLSKDRWNILELDENPESP